MSAQCKVLLIFLSLEENFVQFEAITEKSTGSSTGVSPAGLKTLINQLFPP